MGVLKFDVGAGIGEGSSTVFLLRLSIAASMASRSDMRKMRTGR